MKSDLDTIMRANQIDVVLVLGAMRHNPAMSYFTGPGSSLNLALIKAVGHEPVLFPNLMEIEEVKASGLKMICTNTFPRQEAYEQAGGDMAMQKALEYQWMFQQLSLPEKFNLAIYGNVELSKALPIISRLQGLMPGITLASDAAVDVIQQAKLTKDKEELARISEVGRKAIDIVRQTREILATSPVVDGILQNPEGGALTIGDMHARIWSLTAEKGLDCPHGFIFANGSDAGYPHSSGTASAPIRLGETIVFDFYPCEGGGGYYYDFTRTWCPGYAPDEVRKDYETVKEAFNLVVDSVMPASPFSGYQKLVCEHYEALGHPTQLSQPETRNGYCHALGHGVGLTLHELPVSRLQVEPFDELKPGLVFTIEPGLYYPEKGYGIRLENTFYLDENGKLNECVPYDDDLVIDMKGA